MKKILSVLACLLILAPVALAQRSHRVKTHTRKNGTVVQSHKRTNPNATKRDNWSTKGNTNPTTGKRGTKRP
jgi:hypothetical protein